MVHIVNRTVKSLDHMVLTSAHVKECLAFYELLGFTNKDEGIRYALFLDSFKINVHIQGKELEPKAYLAKPGTLDLCFVVTGDLYEWKDILESHGYEPSAIGIKVGAQGAMHSFYVRDPDKNLIELCSYTTSI